jgi:hypothetical protein
MNGIRGPESTEKRWRKDLMELIQLRPEMLRYMTRLVNGSPWRIFCRGIFIPCADFDEAAAATVFEAGGADADVSFAACDTGQLLGYVGARLMDDAVKIHLLEAVRDDRFAMVAEALLSRVQSVALDRGLTKAMIVPSQPLSSAFELKDDAAVDVLYKMGFWQNLLVAAEMRIGLDGYRVPERIIAREQALAEQGVTIRPCTPEDVPIVDAMFGGDRYGTAWGRLVSDVMDDVDPQYVMLALKDGSGVAYSTFFARTIMSGLPEYGPIFIDTRCRGMGLSSVLMGKSLMQIVALGKAKEVQLSCYPNKFPVYTRQGYHFTHKYLFGATATLGSRTIVST